MRALLAVAALPALLAAAPAHTAGGCGNATSQNEMNRCAAEDYAKADALLNEAYHEQMRDLDDHGRDLLKKAQRAWIGFRDSECTYQNAANEGGSIYPLVYNGCLTKLTNDRIKQLREGQN